MGYIGQQITTVFPTSVSLDTVTASTSLKTPLIEFTDGDDAITIADGGITTFSQNTVGAGGMDLLYAVTSSSSVSSHDISSTYINSTYDNYLLVGYFEGDADTRYLQGEAIVGGVVQTGSSDYGEGIAGIDGENYTNTNSGNKLFTASSSGMGGEDGEGVSVHMTFQNANGTQAPFCVSGLATQHNNNGDHGAFAFSGSFKPASRASVVNGIRLRMHSGNISYAKFKLYGLRD